MSTVQVVYGQAKFRTRENVADSKADPLSKAVDLVGQYVNLLKQSRAEKVTEKPENKETNINRVILNYSLVKLTIRCALI